MLKSILLPYVIDRELALNIVNVTFDIFIHENRDICLLLYPISFTNSRLSPVFANVISNSEM